MTLLKKYTYTRYVFFYLHREVDFLCYKISTINAGRKSIEHTNKIIMVYTMRE